MPRAPCGRTNRKRCRIHSTVPITSVFPPGCVIGVWPCLRLRRPWGQTERGLTATYGGGASCILGSDGFRSIRDRGCCRRVSPGFCLTAQCGGCTGVMRPTELDPFALTSTRTGPRTVRVFPHVRAGPLARTVYCCSINVDQGHSPSYAKPGLSFGFEARHPRMPPKPYASRLHQNQTPFPIPCSGLPS